MKRAPLKHKSRIKRLFWDIETSPNIVLSWRIGYQINIDHDNVLKERAIICIGYKWEHDDEVHCLHWDKHQSDKDMLFKFMQVAGEADELIAHNGDRFDMPWFKARCVFHKIETMPSYKTIDTLQWARKKFLFNSNRLDYIAKFLGIGGKIHTEYNLWKKVVLDNDKKALKDMITYCKYDVLLLEKVYHKLAIHVQHKTHAGAVAGRDQWTCAYCGSDEVIKNMTRFNASGSRRHVMKCKSCHGMYSISDKIFKDYQEVKFDKSDKHLVK